MVDGWPIGGNSQLAAHTQIKETSHNTKLTCANGAPDTAAHQYRHMYHQLVHISTKCSLKTRSYCALCVDTRASNIHVRYLHLFTLYGSLFAQLPMLTHIHTCVYARTINNYIPTSVVRVHLILRGRVGCVHTGGGGVFGSCRPFLCTFVTRAAIIASFHQRWNDPKQY